MKKMKKIFMILVLLVIMTPTSAEALSKSEAIYSNLDYNGKLKTSSVSNHLAFLKEKEEIDETMLQDILNINGEEKFRMDGSKLIWENKGHDIFYRGITEKALPIEVEIHYFLNGKEMNPKKMVGKKGDIKITYHFTNREEKEMQINHKSMHIYTPFVVSVGMMMEGESNKDFAITNGKVISTGERHMVVGLASPGLYQSMGIDELKSLDEVTLTYSTTNFSLSNAYIVATPKFLSEKEFASLGKIEDLYNNMNELDRNMDQLVSGTESLHHGSGQIYEGATTIRHNLKTVKEATSQLQNGSVRLRDGLNTLYQALLAMNENMKQQLQGKEAADILATLSNLQTQNTNVIQNTISQTGMSFEELQTFYQANNLQNYQASDAADPMLKLKNAYELAYLLSSNNSAVNTTIHILSYLEQFETLLVNVETLAQGSSTLTGGISQLNDGTTQLYDGAVTLEQGMQQLVEGAATLENGTKMFSEQGIKKLTQYTNKAKSYSNKIDALVQLSKDYKGFASTNSNSTMFVYTISSIKK